MQNKNLVELVDRKRSYKTSLWDFSSHHILSRLVG